MNLKKCITIHVFKGQMPFVSKLKMQVLRVAGTCIICVAVTLIGNSTTVKIGTESNP